MPIVSEGWTREINNPYFRSAVEIEATLFVEELTFRGLAAITDNGHLYYSDADGLLERKPVTEITATAETGLFLLDGKTRLVRSPEPVYRWNYALDGSWRLGEKPFRSLVSEVTPYQGFVSKGVSESDGEFRQTWNYALDGSWRLGEKPFASGSPEPKLRILVEEGPVYEFAGISLVFDTFNNDYPTDFDVEFLNGAGLVHKIEVRGNTTPRFQSAERVYGANEILLTFKKTFNFDRRIRITDMVFGLTRTFTGKGQSSITSFRRKREISPLMREIPQDTTEFTFKDVLGEYNPDPDNTEGIWEFTNPGQVLTLNYFLSYTNDQGVTVRENSPGGVAYLTARPTTQGQDVTFRASGKLQQLTQQYNHGLFRSQGYSYHALFTELFLFAGVSLYELPDSLKNYYCYLPLPKEAVNVLIQVLCQSIGYIATESVAGYIQIRQNNTEPMLYDMRLTIMQDYPSYLEQLPPLRNLIIESVSVTVAAEITELHKSTQALHGTTTRFIDYEASIEQVATITNGTLVSAAYYAYGADLTISADSDTMEIVITGKELLFGTNAKTYPVNEIGEDALVQISLLSSNTVRDMIAPFYAKYLQEGKRYKLNYLGDPALMANDILSIQTRYVDSLPAMILSSEYSYNNGSSGTLELKNYG